jgi:succinoglycan biosynthesis transport protein ExoP
MNDSEPKFDLRDVLGAAVRRRKAILITALLGLLVTAGLALFLPAYYQSAGTILIEQQELPAELVRSTVTSYADQRVQVISQRVMTTKTLLDIIERYDLYPGKRSRISREQLIAQMRKDIRLNMISADVIDPRSGMPREATIAFSVAYTSPSPDKAVRVANELTTLYLNENITERMRLAQDASAFLAAEGNRLSTRINELEAKMAEFKERSGESLPEVATLNLQMLDRTEQEMHQQEARLMTLDQQRVYLESQLIQIKPNSALMSDTGERIATPADRLKTLRAKMASMRALYSEEHPDIVRMKREIAGLEAEQGATDGSAANDLARRLDDARTKLAEARQKYSAEHPDIQRGEREVAALEAELAQENARPAAPPPPRSQPDNPIYVQLETQLNATRNDQAATTKQIARLRAEMVDYQRKIQVAPQTEKEYRELARDYTNAQNQYQLLRAKQTEAEVAQSLESDRKGERFTLIEPPLPPEEPTSPNRVVIWILGIVLSVGLAAGGAALLEMLDATVRGRKDLLALLGEAPLALIPTIAIGDRVRIARQRLRYALGAVAVAAISAVLAVHFMYRPVDVLWFAMLRKFGL